MYSDHEFGYVEPVYFQDLSGRQSQYIYNETASGNPIVEPDTLFAVLGEQRVPVRVDAEKFPIAVVNDNGQLDSTLRFRASSTGGILRDSDGNPIRSLTRADIESIEHDKLINAQYQRMISGDDQKRNLIIGGFVAAAVILFLIAIMFVLSSGNNTPASNPQGVQTSVTPTENPTVTVTAPPETETTTVTAPPSTETTTKTTTETATETVTAEPEPGERETVTKTVTPAPQTTTRGGGLIPGFP